MNVLLSSLFIHNISDLPYNDTIDNLNTIDWIVLMAELKDLQAIAKNLSLLYIDENQNFLFNITDTLKQAFQRVDDAPDSTIALGHLKVHKYDIVIVDSVSTITNASKLVENIRAENQFQDIIITTPSTDKNELLNLHSLNTQYVIQKPFEISLFF